jgi:mRNA-degrading endonuclease RelE of RelBE toxin-antitoxin system
MYSLEIHKKARETLDFLKNKDLKELKNIIISLDEIIIN